MKEASTPEKNHPWCPWCCERVDTQLKQKVLRLRCKKCGMDAYITRIPKFKEFSDNKSRKMSS